jgi:hypothetical protein
MVDGIVKPVVEDIEVDMAVSTGSTAPKVEFAVGDEESLSDGDEPNSSEIKQNDIESDDEDEDEEDDDAQPEATNQNSWISRLRSGTINISL